MRADGSSQWMFSLPCDVGITCKLVRLGPDEVSAIRAEPIDVLDLIGWDHPTDRWVDLDELRNCYRRAATDGQTIAVVIG